MYRVGDQSIPLCLDCYLKYSQVTQAEVENRERHLNYLEDEMAYMVGMQPTGPRFPPRPRPVVIAGARMQNINVSNSVVGTINTGSIGVVDQSISALVQTGEAELANAVKALSEAVLSSADLTSNRKNELIETLSVVAAEAAAPKERRRSSVARALLDNAIKVTGFANDIADVCQKWWPIVVAAFAVVGG
jgi:hypothetical protein